MEYEKFLNKNGILPIDSGLGKWNHFKIKHAKPKDDVEKNNVKEYIKNKVQNHNGLYVYKNDQQEILYIGKGSPLKNRLYRHYLESIQSIPGHTEKHKFFMKHQGELDIYWIELETEKDRHIIEMMLDYVLNPLFIKPEPMGHLTKEIPSHPLKPQD